VTFSKDSTCQIIIGGVTDFDNGLYLFSYGDGQLRLNKNLGAIPTNIVKAGKPFNYKLSYDIATSPEGTKSLKLGIWFNDVLYKYYETDNYEELVGPNISIVQGDGSTVTIESVGTKVLSTKLKRITFTDFGIADGTYTYAGDLATSGIYAGSLNNVVIAGDVTFSSKPATLLIGGESDVKQGIAITSGTDGNLIVKIGNEMYTLTPDVAGATLVGKSINLQLSYQKINDGLNFGVWINGKLYDNKYFYVSDNVANYLTGRLAVYPESEGASLKLVSEKTEVLDPLLEKFTFADYGISNGTYTGEDNMEVGYSMGGYDGRVFSGDVLFTKSRADIWIGGQDDPWYGIGILSGYTGDETTLCLKADGREYLMTPEVAGTELVGKTVNLKLSYQLVDTDNDGKKDVLKLGVWFNNKLYNNQYFYIKNHEKYMGPYIGLYTALEDSSITVVSDLAVDNPAMGSRRAPSPNTGDGSDAVLYIGLVVVAVVAIIVVSKKQHLE